jgi:hypothetical protein
MAILSALLAGCGTAGAAAGSGPASVTASHDNLEVTAAPARLLSGESVRVKVTVTGPTSFQNLCVQTVHIWALDSAGAQVWEQPVPEIMCMAIGNRQLAPGEKASFDVVWPTERSLQPGSYSIHGLFRFTLPLGAAARVRENLPPVTVVITG